MDNEDIRWLAADEYVGRNSTESPYIPIYASFITKMDANDTASIVWQSAGENDAADIASGRPQTHFSGFLVC